MRLRDKASSTHKNTQNNPDLKWTFGTISSDNVRGVAIFGPLKGPRLSQPLSHKCVQLWFFAAPSETQDLVARSCNNATIVERILGCGWAIKINITSSVFSPVQLPQL